MTIDQWVGAIVGPLAYLAGAYFATVLLLRWHPDATDADRSRLALFGLAWPLFLPIFAWARLFEAKP